MNFLFFFFFSFSWSTESGRTKPSKTFTPDWMMWKMTCFFFSPGRPNIVEPNSAKRSRQIWFYKIWNMKCCIPHRSKTDVEMLFTIILAALWNLYTKITQFTIISSYIYKKESIHQRICIFIKQPIQKNLYIEQSIHKKKTGSVPSWVFLGHHLHIIHHWCMA